MEVRPVLSGILTIAKANVNSRICCSLVTKGANSVDVIEYRLEDSGTGAQSVLPDYN
jgi:hypothetical protein